MDSWNLDLSVSKRFATFGRQYLMFCGELFVKSAHYSGPEWAPFERAVEVGQIADIPVMVDFGSARVRTMAELFRKAISG